MRVQPSRLVSRAHLALPERANCVLVRELEALRFLAERTGLDDTAWTRGLPPQDLASPRASGQYDRLLVGHSEENL
jgi:hypothetical protein